MSTLQCTNLQDTSGGNSRTTAQIYSGTAKAWVNYDGNGGTIRASFNISSITVNSTGKWTVNFTNAFSDANYTVVSSSGNSGSTSYTSFIGAGLSANTTYNNKTASACDIWALSGNNAAFIGQFDTQLAFFR